MSVGVIFLQLHRVLRINRATVSGVHQRLDKSLLLQSLHPSKWFGSCLEPLYVYVYKANAAARRLCDVFLPVFSVGWSKELQGKTHSLSQNDCWFVCAGLHWPCMLIITSLTSFDFQKPVMSRFGVAAQCRQSWLC
jgi:hypothetical protein